MRDEERYIERWRNVREVSDGEKLEMGRGGVQISYSMLIT